MKMKLKLDLGEGGIVGFLARHCEKMVFGLAVVLVAWIAWPSKDYAPLDESQFGPRAINTKVESAEAKLKYESWPIIKQNRFEREDDFEERGRRGVVRVSPDAYPAPVPWSMPIVRPDDKRLDPELYPPVNLEVAAAFGALALANPRGPAAGRDPRALLDAGEGGLASRPLPREVQRDIEDSGALAIAADAKPKPVYVVALKAEIPIKRQRAEYQRVFADAASYSPERDRPHYGAGDESHEFGMVYYVVARAEVAADGTPGQFAAIADSRASLRAQREWAPLGERQFVDPQHAHPNFTSRVPPLMLRDRTPLAVHSNIRQAGAAEDSSDEDSAEEEAGEEGDEPGIGPDIGPGVGPGVGSPPRDPRRPGTAPPRTTPPRPMAGGRSEYGRSEYGREGASGSEEADVWLFRYYDMTVEPGKSYVYKIKLYLEDPNNPKPPAQKLPTRVLDKSVVERLRTVRPHIWWRETPDSEMSPVVRVPATEKVLAGAVNNGDVIQPPGKTYEIRRSEKSVKLMTLAWAKDKALDVPGVKEAARGTVLNFTADAEAIDPFKAGLVTLPQHEFRTNRIVLDIRGGEPFSRRSPLSVPGQTLLMDEQGRLVVHDELEDLSDFKKHNFPPASAAGGEDVRPAGGPRPAAGGRPARDVDIFGS